MKRLIIGLLASLIIFFLIIQFIPPVSHQNEQAGNDDLNQLYHVPQKVQAILKNSCYDCHSNSTNYPWYGHIQPVRYFLDSHVMQGKEELNFSEFANYSAIKRKHKLRAITDALEEKTMPIPSYLLIHQQARLNQQQIHEILSWIKTVEDSDQK